MQESKWWRLKPHIERQTSNKEWGECPQMSEMTISIGWYSMQLLQHYQEVLCLLSMIRVESARCKTSLYPNLDGCVVL